MHFVRVDFQEFDWKLLKLLLVQAEKRNVFKIEGLASLDMALGEGWWYRIFNELGDACVVLEGSVRFRFYKKPSIKNFTVDGRSKPLLRGTAVCMKFVTEDFNKAQLMQVLGLQH